MVVVRHTVVHGRVPISQGSRLKDVESDDTLGGWLDIEIPS